MNLLADVELQLIMHVLQTNELVKFARCNRRILHVARQPFTWKYSMLHLTPDQLPFFNSSTLMQFTPVSIILSRDSLMEVKSLNVDSLLRLAPPHMLRELDSTNCSISCQLWKRILVDSSFRQIRSLRLFCRLMSEVDLQLFKLVAALPHLHSLEISPDFENDFSWRFNLASSSPFTSNSITPRYLSGLQHIAQCQQLRSLSLTRPFLYGERWSKFFASPPMQQLESLTIDSFVASARGDIAPSHFDSTFTVMNRLHTLCLRRVTGINTLLPHLVHSPSLKLLQLHPGCAIKDLSNCIELDVLTQLLLNRPALHCTIHLRLKLNRQPPGSAIEFATALQSIVGDARFQLQFSPQHVWARKQ